MNSMPWTRHRSGYWSSNSYEIKRDTPTSRWRIIRDGAFFDLIDKLPDAKRAAERDWARRIKQGAP